MRRPAVVRLLRAWDVQPGALLDDGRRVVDVQRDPVLRIVMLVVTREAAVKSQVWMAEAPLPVAWLPGEPLLRRRPGVALRLLAARFGWPVRPAVTSSGADAGPVAMVSPDGWRVEQITVVREDIRATLLRVTHHGFFVGEARDAAGLVGLGVPVADLVEEDGQPR